MSSNPLASILLNHPEPLPPELLRCLATTATTWHIQQMVLERPELTGEDAGLIGSALDARWTPVSVRAGVLARQGAANHTELQTRLDQLVGKGAGRESLTTIIRYVVGTAHVCEHLLDLLASSDHPIIVATFARHTSREPAARRAALARLEQLLGPESRRVAPDAASNAAGALAQLLTEDLDAGRAQLLATRTRAVLLALGDDESTNPSRSSGVFGLLDDAGRAHLVNEAVLPTLSGAKRTQKDMYAVDAIVRHLMEDLDVDVLRTIAAAATGERRLVEAVEAEIRRRDEGAFTLAHVPLSQLSGSNMRTDWRAASTWLMSEIEDAGTRLGWDAVLTLASQVRDDSTLEELRDLVCGIAQPAESGRAAG